MDGGFEVAESVVKTLWHPFVACQLNPPIDAKSALQEQLQADGLPLPIYEVIHQEGPSHAPLFQVQLLIKNREPIVGKGPSKREAEQDAAGKALVCKNTLS